MTPDPSTPPVSNIPWPVIGTYIGIGVSLLFNWLNYQRTSRIRSDTIRLEEFKRLRTPVDATLVIFTTIKDSIRSLQASAGTAQELKEQLGEFNGQLSLAYNDLDAALSSLDESQFANGQNWTANLGGRWDALTARLDSCYNPNKDVLATKAALALAADQVDDLVRSVKSDLEAEIVRYCA